MKNSANHHLFILKITVVATLGGLLFGYDTGVISGSQLYFTEYFHLNDNEQGWAVSSALYGCLFGALMAGFLSEKFSRKYALLLSGILFSVSAWTSGIPESLNELVIYRIIGGLGVGIASMVAPMYIAEVAPPAKRGQLVGYYQLAIVIGFFVVFLATYFIGGGNTKLLSEEALAVIKEYNKTEGWRMMFWSELVPALSFFLLLFTVPHSPRWLIMQNRKEEAKQVLLKITSSDLEATRMMTDIQASIDKDNQSKKASPFSKFVLPILIIGTILSVLQQITGINAIMYYGTEIFEKTLGYEDPLKQQLILGAVNLIFTFVAIFTVDKWGRKPLLIVGTLGMFIGIFTLGMTIYTDQKGILSLVGILTFIASFALSMGPVVWVLLSEIFPNNVRSAALSIAVAAQWLFNGIVGQTFPIINGSKLNENLFSGALPYFIFAGFCIVTVLFVWKYVPETKGKTLEEMDSFWHSEK